MTAETVSRGVPAATARVGVIGTGAFAVTLLAQSRQIPDLEIAVICDREIRIAREACLRAGWSAERLVVCATGAAVAQALGRQQAALVDDPELLLSAPIDALVECTGDPEAGAAHALGAIQAGRHVVMVNKETDVVVGPLLNRLASRAGLVYTPVDGDQHGLLIARVQWARTLGLGVVCAGKARNEEGLIAEGGRRIHFGDRVVDLPASGLDIWKPIAAGQGRLVCQRRMAALEPFPRAEEPDLCEMAIVANATGLAPDRPELHSPLVRITEIPELLVPREEGGLLQGAGRMEVVTCLRAAHTPGMGGGVFVVVACDHDPPWDLILSKGFIVNARGTGALLIRPYHLLGIETPRTIFRAVGEKRSRFEADYRPRFDLVARAAANLAAGTRLAATNANGRQLLAAQIMPAQPLRAGHPVPYHLALGRRLKINLAAGEILTVDMLDKPAGSTLWQLRQQQDDHFL